MTNEELRAKIAQYEDLQALIEEAKKESDEIRNQITGKMTELGVEELAVDDTIVRYKPVITKRFDTTSFKRDFGDIYEGYCKPSTSYRFTIS